MDQPVELLELSIPNTWEELVALKDKLPCSVPEATRYPDDLAFYDLYTKTFSRDQRLQIVKTLIGDNDIKIIRNNFPYLFITQNLLGVQHYCLWSKIGPLSAEIVEAEIKKQFSNKDYFWFENIEITKSIPEIWHCQIFVKEN